MKIIAASFQCESNSRAAQHPQCADLEYCAGEDIFRKMPIRAVSQGLRDTKVSVPS